MEWSFVYLMLVVFTFLFQGDDNRMNSHTGGEDGSSDEDFMLIRSNLNNYGDIETDPVGIAALQDGRARV